MEKKKKRIRDEMRQGRGTYHDEVLEDVRELHVMVDKDLQGLMVLVEENLGRGGGDRQAVRQVSQPLVDVAEGRPRGLPGAVGSRLHALDVNLFAFGGGHGDGGGGG